MGVSDSSKTVLNVSHNWLDDYNFFENENAVIFSTSQILQTKQ